MDNTPYSSKRNREEVFTSPESDLENKRHCDFYFSTDTSMSESGYDMEHPGESETNKLVKHLLLALQDKQVLATIGKAVGDAVKPTVKEEISQLIEKQRHLESQVTKLQDRINEHDEVIMKQGEKLDRMEQYERRNNVRITGVAEVQGEDTDKLVLEIAKSISVDLSPADIDVSHQVPRFPPEVQSPPRPIIVRIVSNPSKCKLQASSYRLKRKQQHGGKVFINEDLTTMRAVLAKEARSLVTDGKIESSWVTGGVILVKFKDGKLKKVVTRRHLQETKRV